MSSSVTVIGDLGSTTTELARNVAALMASLYSLQTALINAHGGTPPPSLMIVFSELRNSLKKSWEDIREFLQSSYSFGDDVVTLQESLGLESLEDCMEFLHEMIRHSAQLLERSEKSLKGCEAITKSFLHLVPQFEKVLRDSNFRPAKPEASQQASSNPSRSPQSHAGRWNIFPQSSAGTSLNGPAEVITTNANKATQLFVDSNMAAIRPDGQKALDASKEALVKIESAFAAFIQFWRATTSICQEFILEGKIQVSPKQAASFASQWKTYKSSIKGATASVAKSADAILVHAVGAPPPRPLTPPPPLISFPQERQSNKMVKPKSSAGPETGTTEKPLPNVPPLPPRRGSSGYRFSWSMGMNVSVERSP